MFTSFIIRRQGPETQGRPATFSFKILPNKQRGGWVEERAVGDEEKLISLLQRFSLSPEYIAHARQSLYTNPRFSIGNMELTEEQLNHLDSLPPSGGMALADDSAER